MRSASTVARTEEITQKLKGSNLKSELVLDYETNGSFVCLDDLDESKGVDWDKSLKRLKYANFGLTPVASKIKFEVVNLEGEYSPGSGTTKEGVLDIDTKIRLRSGYVLDSATTIIETLPLNSTADSDYYLTSYNSSNAYVFQDITGPTTIEYFEDLFAPLYDSETYDDSTYTPDSYFVSIKDFIRQDFVNVNSITVNCNTTKGTVYYRLFKDRVEAETTDTDSSFWTSAGSTVSGDATFVINDTSGDRYLQVAVLFDGTTWTDDLRINSITANTSSFIEFLYTDIFYLDTPVFTEPKAPNIPIIQCSGRNVIKRLIENEINIQDTTGKDLDTIIKEINDSVGVEYIASSIDDLSSFGNRILTTGFGQPKKAIDAAEFVMQIINKNNSTKYNMYFEYDSTIEDNIMFIKPKPSDFSANFVFNYKNYESIGARKNNYDKLLKRLTVVNEQNTTDAEVELASATYTTTGQKVLSWSGDAEYKRYVVVFNTLGATVVLDETNPTNFTFTLTGSPINVTITAYGNKWSTPPSFEGEAVNHENMVNNKGTTSRIVNPLVISDTEAKEISEGFISTFGAPVTEANSLSWPYLHLLLELNDIGMLWSRFTFLDDLFGITGIKYHWDNSANPNDKTVFNLDDTGNNFSDITPNGFVYDDVLDYDIGYIYDMRFGPGADISAAAGVTYRNDIDFS